jgi:hypothetical protein
MAFFGLSDITISQEENRRGPLAVLYEEGKKTGKLANTFRYPLDVGNYDKGHYMIFHIFQQNNSQFEGIKRSPEQETLKNYKGASKPSTSFASQINSKIDSAVNDFTKGKTLFGKEISTSFGSSSASVSKQSFSKDQYVESVKDIENKSLLQTTKITSDSIVLYMPDTISFDHSQDWGPLELGKELGGKLATAGKSLIEGSKEGSVANKAADTAIIAAAQALQEKAGKFIGQGSATAGAFLALGGVNNPMLELIYQSPSFREFSYEFMFYPRDEREALEVQNIIERFRFHQAPEIDAGSSGLLLIPPSQFDIQFYYGGKPNPNIPAIGRCVMTGIQVNYAPNGWSAYEMPGENTPALGRTGMPTAIQMTLNFKETVIVTKQAFRTGPGGYKGRAAFNAADKLKTAFKGMTEKN